MLLQRTSLGFSALSVSLDAFTTTLYLTALRAVSINRATRFTIGVRLVYAAKTQEKHIGLLPTRVPRRHDWSISSGDDDFANVSFCRKFW